MNDDLKPPLEAMEGMETRLLRAIENSIATEGIDQDQRYFDHERRIRRLENA